MPLFLLPQNAHLVAEITDARHIIQQQHHRIETEMERLEVRNEQKERKRAFRN